MQEKEEWVTRTTWGKLNTAKQKVGGKEKKRARKKERKKKGKKKQEQELALPDFKCALYR